MANRYWVGGTDLWDGNAGSKWALTSGGTGGQAVPTASDDVFFDGNSGANIITISTTTALAKSLTCTGFTGTIAGTVALSVSGSVTLGSGMTWSHSGTFTINATGTLTSNGIVLANLTKATGAATLTFADDPTVVGAVTLTAGTFDLNSRTANFGSFSSNNTNTKTVAFGASGVINITGTGTVLNFAQSGPTVTGSRTVNIINGGSTTITATTTSLTTSSGFDLSITAGIFTFNTNGTSRNVNFTGFSGAWTLSGGTSIFGNLTVSTGMSINASGQTLTFNLASATQTVQTNGKTFDFPITQNGSAGTLRLLDSLAMGSTRTYTLTNGTLDLNGNTLTVGTTGAFTTGTGTKNITFNGGILACPAATVTAFNNAQPTNFTTTAGTGTGEIRMTAAGAKTFVGGGSTYLCTLSNTGAGALTINNSNNTFTTISNKINPSTLNAPTTFTFTSGTTTTITNWDINGASAAALVTIQSSTLGSQHTLSKSSGTVSADYLSIRDSNAIGGATWNATNSINVSNNNGWNITAPIASANFFMLF
jgi:hypothetical protein